MAADLQIIRVRADFGLAREIDEFQAGETLKR